MYKFLIVFVTLLLLGSAGYYFRSSSGSDLLVQAVTSDGVGGATNIEIYSGTYRCEEKSGCDPNKYFILNGDATLEISEGEGDEKRTIATGSWGPGNGGAIVFIIDPITIGTTSPGYSFVAKNVNGIKISNFSSKVSLLGGVKKPTITRISNE